VCAQLPSLPSATPNPSRSFEVGQRGVAHFVVKSMEEGQGASSEAAVVFSCATGAAGCSNVARNFVVMEKTNSLMKRKIEEHKEKKRREEEEGGGVVKSIQEIRRDANLAKSKLDGTFNVGEQVRKERCLKVPVCSLYCAHTWRVARPSRSLPAHHSATALGRLFRAHPLFNLRVLRSQRVPSRSFSAIRPRTCSLSTNIAFCGH